MVMRDKRPNILFILTDDQGYWSLGCYGNREIKSPNIDALAENGQLFTNFYCTSPVCSPARASILTGLIPSQHGVQDWIKCGNLREDGIDYLEGIEAYTDVLAANGYDCMLSGKWHLGNSFVPQKSFSHWYVHQKGSGDYYNAPMVRDGQAINEAGYITERITDDAIDCIKNSHSDRPFYLSVHYTAPHNPWDRKQYPDKYRRMYENASFDDVPQERTHPKATYVYSPEDARESLIGYYSAVTGVDESVGRLLHALDEKGILEDTLIIFTSDNGFMCGQHGIWGKGNGTFDLNMYDEAVKVPAIFYHKGKLEHRLNDTMLNHYDFFPTILEYCGVKLEDNPKRPGKSFVPVLRGEAGVDSPIVIYSEYGPCRMIRTRQYKYVHRYPYGEHELYDMIADPGEKENLYGRGEYEEVARQLRHEMQLWFNRYTDPAVDASKEPVRGNGQLCRSGIHSGGRIAFDQNRKRQTDPGKDPGRNG